MNLPALRDDVRIPARLLSVPLAFVAVSALDACTSPPSMPTDNTAAVHVDLARCSFVRAKGWAVGTVRATANESFVYVQISGKYTEPRGTTVDGGQSLSDVDPGKTYHARITYTDRDTNIHAGGTCS